MKGALIVFVALGVGLLVLVGRAGRWAELWAALGGQAKMLVPLIALAVVIGACVEVLLTPAQIAGWLGDGAGLRGVLAGWLAGALTPGGGPIGLPLAGALARRGAAMPAVLTYLTSMSLLSLIRLPMEWGLVGGRVTVARWGATLLVPPVIGVCALAWQRWAG